MYQQTATCTSQWQALLLGLGPAVSSITRLTLGATYELLGGSKECIKSICGRPGAPPYCPASFSELTRAVCALTAPALPALQDLYVKGCFEDTAFDVFGSSCPQLTRLQVDALEFQITALSVAALRLTNLACLTIKTPCSPLWGRRLGGYVGATLAAMLDSKSLCKLVLDFDSRIQIRCCPHEWGPAPENLREFAATCTIKHIYLAPAWLSGLSSVSLQLDNKYMDYFHLVDILDASPHLQHLSILGQRKLKLDEEMLSCLPDLNTRMNQGLQLSLPLIRLCGSSTVVMALLNALPTLSSVHSCTLEFSDNESNDLLSHIATVFPNLSELHLWNTSSITVVKLSSQQLGCLRACDLLRQLRIRAETSLDTQALAALCLSMPGLEVIGYTKCEAFEVQELWSALDAGGQAMEVEEYEIKEYGKDF